MCSSFCINDSSIETKFNNDADVISATGLYLNSFHKPQEELIICFEKWLNVRTMGYNMKIYKEQWFRGYFFSILFALIICRYKPKNGDF